MSAFWRTLPKFSVEKEFLMKTFKIIAKITCTLLPVIFIFFGCTAKNAEDYPYLPIIDDSTQGVEASEFIITVSEGASAELKTRARTLCGEIESQTGVKCYIVSDAKPMELSAKSVEVLIGNTCRDISQKALYGMRSDDYICKNIDKTVIIGGKSDSATVKAIDRFCKEILPASTKKALIPENGGFSYFGSYTVESLMLNGIELDGYCIAVDSFNDFEILNTAYEMRDSISEKFGYFLDIELRSSASAFGGNIYLQNPSSEYKSGEAFIAPSPTGLTFCAFDALGVDRCAESFVSLLTEDGIDGDIACTISENQSVLYGTDYYTITSVINSPYHPISNASNLNSVLSSVVKGKSDSVFFDALNESLASSVQKGLESYSVVEGSISAYSKVQCTLIGHKDVGALAVDIYKMGDGYSSFTFVRISGKAEENYNIELSELIPTLDEPLAVVIHTVDSKTVTPLFNGKALTELCIDSNSEYTLSCFGDGEGISFDISLSSPEGEFYKEISIGVDY